MWEVLLATCFEKLICVWLSTPASTEPREVFQKIPSVPCRTFGPGLFPSVGERPDEAWHCTFGAYQQQPSTTYWPACQTHPVRTFLSVFAEEQEISFPSSGDEYIFSYCLVNYKKYHPIKHVQATYDCARQSTSKVNLSSSWVQHASGLSVVIQHLLPKVF